MLVIGVDAQPRLGQRERYGQAIQPLFNCVGGELQIFGGANELEGDIVHEAGQFFALCPSPFPLVKAGIKVIIQGCGMLVEPSLNGGGTDTVGLALINNLEIGVQADQRWPLPHDVVSQTVQRADAVPQMRQHSAFFQKAANALSEVIHSRVDQGNN